MNGKRRSLLRDIWRLVRPYWTSEDRWAGIGLLVVIVGLNLGMVYINVLINQWNNAFYDALQTRNMASFWHELIRFCWLAGAFIIVAVYQLYLNQMLQIRWRKWLTEKYLSEWMRRRTYYRLQLSDYGTDNPDQRISEDLRTFVAQTLNLSLGLLSSVVTLASFIAILWGLSGVVRFSFGGHHYALYGSMVWAGLLYAVVGTWLTHKVGKPLIRLNYDQQRYEADFRFSLVRFRENAEGIALYGGENGEYESFRQRFSHVVRNWWGIMRRQKRLTWFTAGYNQIATIYPFVVAAPRYLAGKFSLGQLMQTASAFGQVQSSLSFFVDSYTDIAGWRAVTQRLNGFRQAIEQAQADQDAEVDLTITEADAGHLKLESVALNRPDGKPLLKDFSLEVRAGESVLIMGPSGTGKSTLFRTVAGIWPYAAGRIFKPGPAGVLFLPQTPYLPIGKLVDAIAYPKASAEAGVEAVTDSLRRVGLGALIPRLDDSGHWQQQLSPGEQQRLAFARALVNRPGWLFLDEASSALDEDSEARLYRLLRDTLPHAGIVSIGHRKTLRSLHERCVEMPVPEADDLPNSEALGRVAALDAGL